MSVFEKYKAECLAEGFEYIGKSSRVKYSVVKCNVCGVVGEHSQDNIRAGKVRCKACHETKMRDAMVVESYAKQLVKYYKIPTDIAKRVFTQSGYNECYTIESLGLLLTI